MLVPHILTVVPELPYTSMCHLSLMAVPMGAEVKLRLQQAHEAGEVSGDHSFLTLTSRQPSAEALEGVPESDH